MTNENETPDEVRGVPLMTDEEIRTLARDITMGKVFTDRHLPEPEAARLLRLIFMPIGLGGFVGVAVEQVGMVYEYLDRAGPRAVNGYPCFFSIRMVHVDQVGSLFEKCRAFELALDAV